MYNTFSFEDQNKRVLARVSPEFPPPPKKKVSLNYKFLIEKKGGAKKFYTRLTKST